MLDSIAASFSAFNRTNTARQSPELEGDASPSSASQLIQNVSSWYETTKKSVMSRMDAEPAASNMQRVSEDPKPEEIPEGDKDKATAGGLGSFEHINL
jgi:hypothetical protein